MKKVFIAGPYTNGDVAQNVKLAMDVANIIIEEGHAPYCPHLTHFLHMNQAQPYEKWLELDKEYLKICDVLIRLKGNSNGADGEVKLAEKLNIPIFYNLKELISYLNNDV